MPEPAYVEESTRSSHGLKSYFDTHGLLTWMMTYWLNPALEPGDTVIRNNASGHTGEEIVDIAILLVALADRRSFEVFWPGYTDSTNPSDISRKPSLLSYNSAMSFRGNRGKLPLVARPSVI